MASYKTLDSLLKDVANDVKRGNGKIGKEISKNREEIGRKYAAELQEQILQNLNRYYASYSPIEHKRTYQQLNMFNSPGLISFDERLDQIHIGFGDSAMQMNAVTSDPHESFVPDLLNYGWRLRNTSATRNNRFNYFEGSFFIDNAIAAFNATHRDARAYYGK
ncbi:hypothetical protein AALA22_08835 [Anaerovoracaceae bacterium 41-7]